MSAELSLDILPSEPVQVIDGPMLAVRRAPGPLRPIVLIPDAGRDGRDWTQVATRVAGAGHEVAIVDLRGQGGSEPAPDGLGGSSGSSEFDTDTCADDVAALIDLLGFSGGRSPVVAGHGWGANVALSMAARRNGVAGLACFDGGWLRSYDGEPRAWYPLVRVPVLLAPAVPADDEPDPRGTGSAARSGVAEAAAGLPESRVSWYSGAGHDLPRTRASRVADDLLALAAATEPAP